MGDMPHRISNLRVREPGGCAGQATVHFLAVREYHPVCHCGPISISHNCSDDFARNICRACNVPLAENLPVTTTALPTTGTTDLLSCKAH